MITTTVKDTVYGYLYGYYSKLANECFSFITPQLTAIISKTAYDELIQMAQRGLLNEFYERIKRNAI